MPGGGTSGKVTPLSWELRSGAHVAWSPVAQCAMVMREGRRELKSSQRKREVIKGELEEKQTKDLQK